MAEKFNRTRLADLYVESMMRVNPKYIDFVHAEMVRCASIIGMQGISCSPPPRIVVTRQEQLLPAMFVKPNLIAINFPMINSMDQLTTNFREVMATYAMHMAYVQQQQMYKYVQDIRKVERPKLNTYQSPEWRRALAWFTN